MNPTQKRTFGRILIFLAGCLMLFKFWSDDQKKTVMNQVSGQTMGTITYNIKYKTKGEMDYKSSVDSLLEAFNLSLSTYIPHSEISQFNQLNSLRFSSPFFYPVLEKSREVFDATSGAFDPTVGPVVNAWGFGPNKQVEMPNPSTIDSLLGLVGFEKLEFSRTEITKPSGTYLDFSAVAKGYAIDVVAEFLEQKSVKDYMVEIGGEVRTAGTNDKNKPWAIGIEDPLVDRDERKLLAIANMENRSLATSGNYRNYFEKDGQLFAHIIDPRTGYTAKHNLLSASVFARDCMTADAYATAFMVMGLEKAMEIVRQNEDLDAVFIYSEDGQVKVEVSEGIKADVNLLEPDPN